MLRGARLSVLKQSHSDELRAERASPPHPPTFNTQFSLTLATKFATVIVTVTVTATRDRHLYRTHIFYLVIRVSIWTTRTTIERPCLHREVGTILRALRMSSRAAHSVALPRAME